MAGRGHMGNFLHNYSLVVLSGAADYMLPYETLTFLDFYMFLMVYWGIIKMFQWFLVANMWNFYQETFLL